MFIWYVLYMSPISKITNPLRDQWIGILTKVRFPLAFAIFFLYWFFINFFPNYDRQLRDEAANCQKVLHSLDTSVVKILDKVNECKKGDVK